MNSTARNRIVSLGVLMLCSASLNGQPDSGATEFCLQGEFNLGARLQGRAASMEEFYPTRWCVITESANQRVRFHARGRSNADIDGEFIASYLPPDTVRIVALDGTVDLEFNPVDIAAEAARHRRMNPELLLRELRANPGWLSATDDPAWQELNYPSQTEQVQVRIEQERLQRLRTWADLPLRGRVPVEWRWDWEQTPVGVNLVVDGLELFRGQGLWRPLEPAEAAQVWRTTAGRNPQVIPGVNWPARVDMRLERLEEDIYLVNSVRSGFNHLVVDTEAGLIVGDAPAGWVELYQIPPGELVPTLGISGLSERFIDFLNAEFPGKPIHAVALTHGHDDHIGGARAFAAAGATIYAPAPLTEFLTEALNRAEMPPDRLSAMGDSVQLQGVTRPQRIGEGTVNVSLLPMAANPHSDHALGILAGDPGYFFQSDVHVPGSDAGAPIPLRAETECWFARWAADNLAPETVVLSSHTAVRTPVSRLADYLDSNECRSAP